MNMKSILPLILIIFLFSNNVKAQQSCELASDFKSNFEKFSEEEGKVISEASDTFSSKLKDVIDAINDETILVIEDFQKYIAMRASYQDTMNKIAVTRARKLATTKSQITNRIPDFDDRACAKATNASNNVKTKIITSVIAKANKDQYSEELNAQDYSGITASTNLTFDNHLNWFSEAGEGGEDNIFLNADVNAGSLYNMSTFKEDTSYTGMPSTENTPNTLIAAQQYVRNIIDNNGVSKNTSNKIGLNKKLARKNLAYGTFADMLARRTTISGSNTGTALRALYTQLGIKADSEFSATEAENIADDISQYEYKDYSYSKLYMNPDWIVSLEAPEKALQIEELEVVNKNMALEWDTLLMLEKLATLDSVNLASDLDSNN